MLADMARKLRVEHPGEKAERVVGEVLRRRRWTEATLGERKKGDREKLKMAVRLRKETLVTVLDCGAVADGQRGQCEHAAVSVAAG